MSLRTFAYKALGCKVNQYEGDAARAWLESNGLIEVSDRADLVVLNTCAVTHRAVQKGRQALRRLLLDNPGAASVLTGCMTPADIPSFEKISPRLLVTANRDRDRLIDSLREIVEVETTPSSPEGSPAQKTRAFLKVQDGCNLRCSYCIIPTLRGRSRSRPLDEVVEEFRRLESAGHLEVVLCGIHLGHWGHEFRSEIADLVRALAERSHRRARIRLSSLEANELSSELIGIMAESPQVVPHLHLPLQSGSERLLKQMRRPYTAALYREKTEEFRERLESPALTTDVIVGFPGETDEDFAQTLALSESAGFSKVHAFPFSARQGTDASQMADPVHPQVVRDRQALLTRVERKGRQSSHQSALFKPVMVIAESRVKPRSPDNDCGRYRYTGFTERYQRVEFETDQALEGPSMSQGFQVIEPIRDCGSYLEAKWLGTESVAPTLSPS